MRSRAPHATGSPISGADPKIVTVGGLAAIAERARREGRKVVQAHGTFDLLHLGHVRHLEAARRHGDLLVVTVTADAFVKKGPGRPAFRADQRADMLAALAVVDHVAVDPHADGVAAIREIRPDVFVKGSEYADAAADVTGKIAEERAAVEAHGGRVAFTDEPTFSSSALINRHLEVHEPRLAAHLERLRSEGALDVLLGALERVRALSVLVVGEAIVDEYEVVAPLGKTGKGNLVAHRLLELRRYTGGAHATANHLSSFCARVEVAAGPREPVVKRRLVEEGSLRKLFEVYAIDDEPPAPAAQRAFDDALARQIGGFDVVVANDFGHGLIGPSTVGLLGETARFLAVNTQTNAENRGFNLIHKYPRADYVCLDAEEARLAVVDRRGPLDQVARALAARVRCDRFAITRGRDGCLTYRRGEDAREVPGMGGAAIDTLGAGDAFLALTAPLVAVGLPLELAGFAGNVAGALKCAIAGHERSVDRIDVVKSLTALLK